MNLAFIEQRTDSRTCSPQHTAADGLNQLGYEIQWFKQDQFDSLPITRDTLVVGYIETVLRSLDRLEIKRPPNIDYPESISHRLGRKITASTLAEVRDDKTWPVFVKPIHDHKIFAGRVFKEFRDLLSSSALPGTFEVWRSDVVDFASEWRCFLFKGKVVGCQFYKGDPLLFPDAYFVEEMAEDWKGAPIACCFDVGVTKDYDDSVPHNTSTLLVEVNDGHSMGDYGLNPILYARMIEARWCELTGAKPIP